MGCSEKRDHFPEKDQKIRNQHTEKLKYQRSLPLESSMYTGLNGGHWTKNLNTRIENLIDLLEKNCLQNRSSSEHCIVNQKN